MNEKTATKLNDLLTASKPVTFLHDRYYWVVKNGKLNDSEYNAITTALTRALPMVLTARIQDGAKNRDYVHIPNINFSPSICSWSTSEDVVTMALPEIEAIVNQHNKNTLNQYETYRTACEQGVAVPPKT